MKTTRDLVTLTVFGTLWGAMEMSLGALLHAMHVPMAGTVLAAGGLAIALIGRVFVPRRGSTLAIGAIAVTLKLFSIGSVVIGPMIGILVEAAIAEAVLTAWGRPRRAALVLAGGLGVLWTLIQPFVTGLVLYGRDLFVVWLDILSEGGRLLGLGTGLAGGLFAILAALRLALGGLAGWLAWSAGQSLLTRLNGPSTAEGADDNLPAPAGPSHSR